MLTSLNSARTFGGTPVVIAAAAATPAAPAAPAPATAPATALGSTVGAGTSGIVAELRGEALDGFDGGALQKRAHGTQPRPLRRLLQPDAPKVEPLERAVGVVAAHHLTERHATARAKGLVVAVEGQHAAAGWRAVD